MQRKSSASLVWIIVIFIIALIIIGAAWHSSSKSWMQSSAANGSPTISVQPSTGYGVTVDLHRTYSSPLAESMIQVRMPTDDMVLASSTLAVSGFATSSWFSANSFPMSLIDGNGSVLSTGVATAEGSSNVANPVPFSGVISYTLKPSGTVIYLVLKNNPAGTAAGSQWVKIPLVFK